MDIAGDDSRFKEVFSPWAKNYVRTPSSIQRDLLRQELGLQIKFLLDRPQTMRYTGYSGFSRRLLLLGDEEEDLTGWRAEISSMRYPVGKKVFSQKWTACDSGDMPSYLCRVCPRVQLCHRFKNEYSIDKVSCCSGHEFLDVDASGWFDVDKGIIEQHG
jgi:hypothetical protein